MFKRKKVLTEKLVSYLKNNEKDFYYLVFSYVKNEQAALDVIQESIYKAMKNIHTLRDEKYLKTWFCRILINTSISYLRKNARFILTDECDMDSYFSYEETDQAEIIDLYRAIDALDKEQRTIIILRFFEDMKLEDISQILDCNINTVKSRLYSALKKLRLTMEGE